MCNQIKPGFLQGLSVFVIVSLVFCTACVAHADDPESTQLEIRALKERIDQLESRLKVFEQRQSTQASTANSATTNGILLPPEQPKPTSGMNAKGPSLPQ